MPRPYRQDWLWEVRERANRNVFTDHVGELIRQNNTLPQLFIKGEYNFSDRAGIYIYFSMVSIGLSATF